VAIAISVNRTHINKKNKDDHDWAEYNKSFRLEVMDTLKVADAITSGFSITAAHHTKRHSDNFISAQHLGLDFDSSSIAQLMDNQFVADYASIIHTTSSHKPDAPRSRAIFVLDSPIINPVDYSDRAKAAVWYNNQSDIQCSDAVRLWFGAKNCQMEIQHGKLLPISLLNNMLSEYSDSQKTLPENGGFVSGDPVELLDRALKDVKAGTRHHVGFKLCCGLRDIGLPIEEAMFYVETYQRSVEKIGDHPYELKEILASLRGAYTRKPRTLTEGDLFKRLVTWESAAWYGRKGLKHGGIHYSLKTVMAVSQIAEKVGRVNDIALPVRDFIEYGIPKSAASTHLKAMQEAGVLNLDTKSDTRRSSRYSLAIPEIPDVDNNTIDIATSSAYKKLQAFPHFDYKAKIDPDMWKSKTDDLDLGPSALRVIATLATAIDWNISAKPGQSGKSNPTSYDCPGLAPILSMQDLWRQSGVAERSGKRVFKALCELGICQWEYADHNEKAKIPALTENWYERLIEIAPALTTYGKKEILMEKYNNQRELHHSGKSGYGTDEDKELSGAVAKTAYAKSVELRKSAERVNQVKAGWRSNL